MKTSTKNAIITGICTVAASVISIVSYSIGGNIQKSKMETTINQSGVITINQNENSMDTIERIINECVNFQNDYHSMSIDYTNLKNDYDVSIAANEELSAQINLLKTENESLSKTYNDLKRKYQELLKATEPTNSSPVLENIVIDKVWIDQLDIFYQEGKHISGSNSGGWCKLWDSSVQKDALGNEHNHGIYVRGYREDTYIIEYVLDDAYIGLKGLFTLEYASRNIQTKSNLKVYSLGNDREKKLLFNAPQSLYGGIKPIPFDISIYEADHIQIEISSDTGEREEFFLALVDTYFYK